MQHRKIYIDDWSLLEKICLVSGVLRYGENDWTSVCNLIKPKLHENRPWNWFTAETCEAQYKQLYNLYVKIANNDSPVIQIIQNLKLKCKEEASLKDEQWNRYNTVKKQLESVIKNEVENDLLDKYYEDAQREKKKQEEKIRKHAEWLKKRDNLKAEFEKLTVSKSSNKQENKTDSNSSPITTSPLLSSLLNNPPAIQYRPTLSTSSFVTTKTVQSTSRCSSVEKVQFSSPDNNVKDCFSVDLQSQPNNVDQQAFNLYDNSIAKRLNFEDSTCLSAQNTTICENNTTVSESSVDAAKVDQQNLDSLVLISPNEGVYLTEEDIPQETLLEVIGDLKDGHISLDKIIQDLEGSEEASIIIDKEDLGTVAVNEANNTFKNEPLENDSIVPKEDNSSSKTNALIINVPSDDGLPIVLPSPNDSSQLENTNKIVEKYSDHEENIDTSTLTENAVEENNTESLTLNTKCAAETDDQIMQININFSIDSNVDHNTKNEDDSSEMESLKIEDSESYQSENVQDHLENVITERSELDESSDQIIECTEHKKSLTTVEEEVDVADANEQFYDALDQNYSVSDKTNENDQENANVNENENKEVNYETSKTIEIKSEESNASESSIVSNMQIEKKSPPLNTEQIVKFESVKQEILARPTTPEQDFEISIKDNEEQLSFEHATISVSIIEAPPILSECKNEKTLDETVTSVKGNISFELNKSTEVKQSNKPVEKDPVIEEKLIAKDEKRNAVEEKPDIVTEDNIVIEPLESSAISDTMTDTSQIKEESPGEEKSMTLIKPVRRYGRKRKNTLELLTESGFSEILPKINDIESDSVISKSKNTVQTSEQTDDTNKEAKTDSPANVVTPLTKSRSKKIEEKSNTKSPEELKQRKKSTRKSSGKSQNNTPTDDKKSIENNELQQTRKKLIMLAYSRLTMHKYANAFQKPITNKQVPGYENLIYQPMDLYTIKRKIENRQVSTVTEFQRDVLLMLNNAKMFNRINSQVYNMAVELEAEALPQIELTVQTLGEGILRKTENTTLKIRKRQSFGDDKKERKLIKRIKCSSNEDNVVSTKKLKLDDNECAEIEK